MATITPAIASIESGEILPLFANELANRILIDEGIDPVRAFVDPEINRHHRAVALSATRANRNLVDQCLEQITEGR